MGAVNPAEADRFLDAAARADTEVGIEIVLGLFRRTGDVAGIIGSVLAPVQVEVGRRWEVGSWTVAEEHAASAVVDAALTTLEWTAARSASRAPMRASGASGDLPVVVACVEREWHSLPARLAAAELAAAGLAVSFLGPSLPASPLADHLARSQPVACGLSCTTPTNLVAARRAVAASHRAGVPVVIGGGAVPDRARAAALGADGWAENGSQAASLVRQWRRAPPEPPVAVPLPPEVDTLDAPPARLLDDGVDELLMRHPDVAGYGVDVLQQTRANFTLVLEYAAAALVVDDPELFLEFTDWLVRVQSARGESVETIVLGYEALAAAIAPSCPNGNALLSGALNILPDV